MQYEDFGAEATGRLIPTVYGARAFVPDDLPPRLDLAELALSIGNAGAAIGELRGACRRLQNPYILIAPLQRLEAQTSSAMEGTHTTADELVLSEAGIAKEIRSETTEVANYIRALREAVDSLTKLPISNRVLKGAHRTLLAGVGHARGQDKRPGEFKRDQNMIGGNTIETARFIPAPPAETEPAMAALERFLNRPDKSNSSPLIDMALAHYQFETIHPFADGNGRVGRMLVSLMALTEGLLDVPALYLSPELEVQKDRYIDLMYQVSCRGVWEEWILFFLSCLQQSCARTVDTIDKILTLQSDYRQRASQASRSANLLGVIDLIFENPAINPRIIVERVGVTDAAARNLLRTLTEAGILREVAGFYPKVWLATELLEVARRR